ncbi:DNA repair protein [Leucosporidium creatinivorum]|uniref:DNA repair protein n=1 Tax=Leucosporidium creatinivorum TaxID=106004 RepID=A0A1Y2G293_9BASI|nr:DNA repair protein [Leucosporidium creatinivorum]
MSTAQLAKIAALKQEIAQLEKELDGEDPNAIVKRHIKLLHLYNERKDATQGMIGKIATMQNVTVREVQDKLGIDDQ